jgi:hypothetical protein
LRLYDRQGQQCLNRGEAEYLARVAAEQREAAERAARETQRELAEIRASKELAWAKLRELGIDPEKL